MGFSPLANASRRIPDRGRYNIRNSRIRGFTIHHNAGVDSYAEAWNPNREVSANYWILNDGTILGNIDENYRAWTTGAAAYPAGAASDHRNITVEVSNSPEGVRNGTWAVSDAAMRSLSALIGDVFKRHGLGRVTRGTYDGVAVHQDFVPTSCPGPYIMARLGTIIREAEQARVGETDPLGGIMGYYKNKQSFRSDLRDIIRRHVPLAEMKSAFNGAPSNIASEIRRAYHVGAQNRIKNDRAEAKIDALSAKVDELEKIIQTVGESTGLSVASMTVDTAIIEQVERESRERLAAEADRDDAETEVFLAQVAREDEADAEQADAIAEAEADDEGTTEA